MDADGSNRELLRKEVDELGRKIADAEAANQPTGDLERARNELLMEFFQAAPSATAGDLAAGPQQVTISLEKREELARRVASGELTTQQASMAYGVPESFIEKLVPAKSTAQTATMMISVEKKEELVARVISGQLTIQQAGLAYGVPEAFIDEWVAARPPGSGEPPKQVPTLISRFATFVRGLFTKGRTKIKDARKRYKETLNEAFGSKLVIPIAGKLVIGRDPECDHTVDNAQVSRQHTLIDQFGETYVVTDLGSSNGTFINGNSIRGNVTLQVGDLLNIGPYHFTFNGKELITDSASGNVDIICDSVCKEVTDRSTGKKILILNNVSLHIKPCEFTVIIGPSGGGKSTLLNAISGRNPASSGDVLINGQNLYTHFDALKKNMALVPQKDVLHTELRLRNALLYTARLRLPPDLGVEECGEIVDEYLETVTLTERSGTTIKDLSGGQIKRASLANEIISEPNLLFVDEATSGLDEHTDGEIMNIFREIAEAGKTVICITHNLTNVEKFCHKVVILAPGGFLTFVGTAEEAREYFNIVTLGDVYIRLRDKASSEWESDFRQTAAYKEIDVEVQKQRRKSKNQLERRLPLSFSQKMAIFVRQLSLLSKRGWEIQLSDLKSMAVMGIQCLFVGVLICMLFGDYPLGEDGLEGAALIAKHAEQATFAGRAIFLLTVSSFWFGCNNAAKEIVKEKEIYERERDVFLNVISYYTAKFLMLAVITTAQVFLLLGMVNFYTGLPGSFSAQVFSITIIGICGVATGLLISAISKNSDMAVTLVPVAIIPQVILAGLIFPLDGLAEFVSKSFISCYWAYGNTMSSLPGDVSEAAKYGDWSYLSAGVVLVHTGLLIAAANGILYAADKRLSLKGSGIDTWLKNTAKKIQGVATTIPQEQPIELVSSDAPSLPDVMVEMQPTFVVDDKTESNLGDRPALPDAMLRPPATLRVGDPLAPQQFGGESTLDSPSRHEEEGWTLSLPENNIRLAAGLRVMAADIRGLETRELDGAVAEVVSHPQDPNMVGLRNLTVTNWNATLKSGEVMSIEPGKSVRIESGVAIDFGPARGVVN